MEGVLVAIALLCQISTGGNNYTMDSVVERQKKCQKRLAKCTIAGKQSTSKFDLLYCIANQ